MKEYPLTTVSYGVSSSPFLAIRTLRQLIEDEGQRFPAASEALRFSTYMDDIVTSVPSVEAAKQLQSELTELLIKGQFELRKWASNHPAILSNLPPEHCAIEAKDFTLESDKTTKILGFQWNPIGDYLFYRVKVPSKLATKRNILSTLAQIFDPLGYLTPFMLTIKSVIQYLWQSGCDWDDIASVEVVKKWEFICNQLPLLEKLNIPRCLNFELCENIQLHGFADSSERGYAGVVYLRASLKDGSMVCTILRSKAKVAPLKKITLPRLELCAVVLVARLYMKFKKCSQKL
ncbi:uncharacterized protein LOC111052529 [Nilaparvata lugens]|uniref:uncharacterized protein LOC111052529 n=1 Tax=Nilaparvata lugens TaxID=108931 RepID=UPI00193CAFC8|nr:uncharacterized protein LOC111052529 [Nilaparvata lugens]